MKVSLFVTCLVDQLFPDVGVSAVRLLRQQGVKVEFPPDQTCCGQPLFNSGFLKEAKALGRRVLGGFEGAEYVVVPSGSCAAMMRVFYPRLFRDDAPDSRRSQALAPRVYELSEFLVKVLGVTDVGARFEGKVAYHPSCHLLRELEASAEAILLLKGVAGAEVVPLEGEEVCCGFGGTFSVKYPSISGSMLQDKVEAVARSGADALVACDMSCLMHIGGGLSRKDVPTRPMHLAQLLCTPA